MISGTGLTQVATIMFGNIQADFSDDSPLQVTVIVPSGAADRKNCPQNSGRYRNKLNQFCCAVNFASARRIQLLECLVRHGRPPHPCADNLGAVQVPVLYVVYSASLPIRPLRHGGALVPTHHECDDSVEAK